jgi:pilus assembly protein Flp/PilA
MSSITNAVRRFVKDEQGISVTEYGLLIAFVAVALIVVVNMAGSKINAFFSSNLNKLSTGVASP